MKVALVFDMSSTGKPVTNIFRYNPLSNVLSQNTFQMVASLRSSGKRK